MDHRVAMILVFTVAGSVISGALIFQNAEGDDSTAAWIVGGAIGFIIGAGTYG